jgi:hypothetical protein
VWSAGFAGVSRDSVIFNSEVQSADIAWPDEEAMSCARETLLCCYAF